MTDPIFTTTHNGAIFDLMRISNPRVNPDLAIVAAARTSFQGALKGEKADSGLLRYLYSHRHTSPFEMADYLILVKGLLEPEWWVLVSDPRFRMFVKREQASVYGYVRVDLNNAIRFITLYPKHLLAEALRVIMAEYNPWTAAAVGLEPTGEVTYPSTLEGYVLEFVWGEQGEVLLQDEGVSEKKIKALMAKIYDPDPQKTWDGLTDLSWAAMFPVYFRIKAPAVVWWQLVRHRLFSINLQSGRYMEFEDDDIFFPPAWRRQSESNKQGSAGDLDAEIQAVVAADYDELVKSALVKYHKAIEMGVAKEMARLFLPGFSVMYNGVVKADWWALRNFFSLRCAPDAQQEIRQVAEAMRSLLVAARPSVVAKFAGE